MAQYSGILAARAIKKRTDLLEKIRIAEGIYNQFILNGKTAEAKKQKKIIDQYKKQARYSAYRAYKHGG